MSQMRLRKRSSVLKRYDESESDTESDGSWDSSDTSNASASPAVDIPHSETSSFNSNPTLNNISIENKIENIVNNLKSFSKQREIEMQDWKHKCQNQEIIISSIKECLNVDNLEREFKVLTDSKLKIENANEALVSEIKTLENSKLKAENANKTLKRKYDTAVKQLNTEKSLRLSAESSRQDLLKKVDDLTKQLKNEKALRSTAEDKVFLLESNLSKSATDVPNSKTATDPSTKIVDKLNGFLIKRFPLASLGSTHGRNASSMILLSPEK